MKPFAELYYMQIVILWETPTLNLLQSFSFTILLGSNLCKSASSVPTNFKFKHNDNALDGN